MTRSTFLLRLVTVALLAACGAASPAQRAPAPAKAGGAGAAADAGPFAPTPYTARQIREATRVGRSYTFAVEAAGEPRRRQTITFTDVNEAGLETRVAVFDEAGVELAPAKKVRSTWDELRKHAEFPREAVTIDEEAVTLPAGSFDCVVYTVRRPGEVSRFYFAKALPGAPVFFTTEKAGVRVYTQQLVEHRAGGAS